MDLRDDLVHDSKKCRMLSIEERRETILELSKRPECAPEKLHQWSRRDLLEILCAEMGKERKYTGLSKQRMIEHLFKIVSEKRTGTSKENVVDVARPPPTISQMPPKRPRKTDNPSRAPLPTSDFPVTDRVEARNIVRCCENLACRAPKGVEDLFCKRCSCCICHKYDDNKDPSVWLVCSPDTPTIDNSCGISCHLECALIDDRAGIMQNGQCTRLDGSYYCTYCGKANDLLGCWRKQLLFAKEARRVDVLCHRISLSHRLLRLTEKYRNLHEIVDEALKKLESEVGPIDGRSNMSRGIVNRLTVGTEVQKLCARAVELLDSMIYSTLKPQLAAQNTPLPPSTSIKFSDVSATSLSMLVSGSSLLHPEVIGYRIRYRKADSVDYPTDPIYTIMKPQYKFTVKELIPDTRYTFKVTAFGDFGDFGKFEAAVKTASFLKDASCNTTKKLRDLNKLPESSSDLSDKPEILDLEKSSDDNQSIAVVPMKMEIETPGNSGSGVEDDPNIQIDSQRDSTNSIEKNHRTSGQVFCVAKPAENQLMVVPYGLCDTTNNNSIPVMSPATAGSEEGRRMQPYPEGGCFRPYGLCDTTPPINPGILEDGKEASGRTTTKAHPTGNVLENPPRETLMRSSSKKRDGSNSKHGEICTKNDCLEGVYEHCVKVVRWLEREGHIETDFRKKFLTWFSIRATLQERKIVGVYVDTMMDDPSSLAGQLADTFSESIYSKGPPPAGFCMRLWH